MLELFHLIKFIQFRKSDIILFMHPQIMLQTDAEISYEMISPAKLSRLSELQGECKILSMRPLRRDWLKTFLLIIPIAISVIGLLLIKYYHSLRVKLFYTNCSWEEATYVFIEGTGGIEQIQKVNSEDGQIQFFFKKLKYTVSHGRALPAGFLFQDYYDQLFTKSYLIEGSSQDQLNSHLKKFGKNQHHVQIPNYFEYLFDIMTKPFFLLQYMICIIYFLEGIPTFGILMIAFSLLTTSINYVLLFISYQKIKEMAEKTIKVCVIRSGSQVEIDSSELVPGDLMIPEKGTEIVCDALLVQGQVYVNEASLTGESIPIGKFSVGSPDHFKEENRWLFEGGKILECRAHPIALVVNTGYATRRGRIIRKILTRVPKDPDFFLTAVYFLLETCVVAIILYFATLYLMLQVTMPKAFIVYRFLDFLVWSFPPTFPIYFNLAYSFSLVRLRKKGIIGTQPEKTVDGAKVRVMCFDKTGTLTQNAVEVHEIIKFIDANSVKQITQSLNDQQNILIAKLFSSCHTVKYIEGQFLGDQVDLRMFLYSNYKMSESENEKIKFIVEGGDHERLEILRINQFESKFQNMSVLVRDVKQGKYYAFVKGAPERIDKNSKLKVKQFENLVSNLSLGGYRTIAYAFREIKQSEIETFLNGPRDIYESDITALGLVAFENKLKGDTRETIDRLIESAIQPKMITGDNIYIAVETGVRAGIIKKEDKVILLEGRKQVLGSGDRKFSGILLQRKEFQTIKTPITLDERTDYLNQTYPIAIDNDFLMLKPEPHLPPTIKLFSRTSPENKALIVKRFKQQMSDEYDLMGSRQKFFGNGKSKVGMCGDGANDLMAIRQSDFGVGISDSDASYGASFSIVNMLDCQELIRESKCTNQSIVEMIRYFGTSSFIKIIAAILLVSDATYFAGVHITYFNFASTIWIPVIFALSSPSQRPSRYAPVSNMMSMQNHIIYWLNIALASGGMCAGYFYYQYSGQFVPNEQPIVGSTGYFGYTCSSTVVWLMINIPFIVNAFSIYTGDPFKIPFYRNILLDIFLIGNLCASIAFFFTTATLLKTLGLRDIPVNVSGPIFGIISAAVIINAVLNYIMQRMELYKKAASNQKVVPVEERQN